jgi:hypothetical protein
MGARAPLDILLIWFGYIARLSQCGGGGNLLVQIIPTCRRGGLEGGRGGGSAPFGAFQFLNSPFYNIFNRQCYLYTF